MAASPSRGPLVPSFDILINGSAVPAAVLRSVDDVVVDENVHLPGMFTFAVVNADDDKDLNKWVDNTTLFSIGNEVEIKLGDAGHLTSLIKGEITTLELAFLSTQRPTLRLRGYDRAHRLQRGRKTRTFVQKSDSDIASQIGQEAQLKVDATNSGAPLDYVMQANQTDWEFLCGRAERIRYEVLVRDKTLLFRPAANDKSEGLTLSMDNDLLEFHPRLSSAGQATGVKVQGWSVKDKEALSGASNAGDEVSSMGGSSSGAALVKKAFGDAFEVMARIPVSTQAEADQLAKARFNARVLTLIEGEGLCRGRTDIRAGIVVRITGVGKRFGGQYYVTSAVHRYSSVSGYLTEFAFRRNAI